MSVAYGRRLIGMAALVGAVLLMSGIEDVAAAEQAQGRFLVRGRTSPFMACDAEELARLRQAWGEGAAPLKNLVAKAEKGLGTPVEFPPRGGQHNQWYQCEKCQTGLNTLTRAQHKCPVCNKVYTGAPFDDVIYEREHYALLERALNSAWAWAATQDRRFAEDARAILKGYAERYLAYPYHDSRLKEGAAASSGGGHLFEQTLNEAAALAERIAPAYDLVRDTLSFEERAAIRDGLLLPRLRNIDKNKRGKSNWQSWHNAGMLWGGAMVEDETWMDKALNAPEQGFFFQMRASVTAEGMWYETSWGYHFYTLGAMTALAEGSRRAGVDIWSHPKLKAMFLLPAQCVMPDGSLPRFGDAAQTAAAGAPGLMEAAWRAYQEPSIQALLPARASLESVLRGRATDREPVREALPSRLLPGAGHAVLRTQGPAGLAAVMTFSEPGGGHGHFDKLSFVFFGCGTELGVDPGRAKSQAYRLPIHKDWYRATGSHNTVVVDGRSQEPATGKALLFGANGSFAAAAAQCDAGYAGVLHRRLLVMTPEYLAVIDDLASDGEKRFDWLYHNRGGRVECDAALADSALPKGWQGAEYLRHVRTGRVDGPVVFRFENGQTAVHALAAGEKGTLAAMADGVGASTQDRVPMMMLSRVGRGARFAVVLEPAAGGAPSATGAKLAVDGAAVRVEVARGQSVDEIEWRTDSVSLMRGGQEALRAGPAR